jgi:hypothetical protein
MVRGMPAFFGAILALAMVAAADHASAQSFGFMHMPSTVPQYLGWGYGAGHQAPIVKTPGYRPERQERMTFAPRGCSPMAPAPYVMIGCYDGGCAGGCPSCGGYVPATAVPTPAPAAPNGPEMSTALPPGVQPSQSYVWR